MSLCIEQILDLSILDWSILDWSIGAMIEVIKIWPQLFSTSCPIVCCGGGGYLEGGGRATGRQQFIDHTAWRLLEVEYQAIKSHPAPFNGNITQDIN